MTSAEVLLWGRRIGAVLWDPSRTLGYFEYDAAFTRSGIEVAPLTMPLSERESSRASAGVFSFPELDADTFHGLPGLLADVLPDRFGTALIESWLASLGRPSGSFDPVERLSYTGRRGMGALEFRPATHGPEPGGGALAVDELVRLAELVLTDRARFVTTMADVEEADAVRDILRVGTSAGGARAKAVIAWNPDTGEVRSGQADESRGFSHWLMKFDGVRANRDKELEDPMGHGRIEYAYARMAREAGIRMEECRLLEENGRAHFMTRRFDRDPSGEKLHMQSLCALAHLDFNLAGAHSYERCFAAMRALNGGRGLGMDAMEEQFRRMVFNVVARNQDDHTKNIAFLMDRAGRWSLSPAFDLIYAYNPSGAWTSRHQMSIQGKRDGFTDGDFRAVGKLISLARGRADAILAEVRAAVAAWPCFADEAGVSAAVAAEIASNHRLEAASPR